MPCKPDPDCQSLIPEAPIPAEVIALSRQLHGLLDGKPKDEAAVNQVLQHTEDVFDRLAAGLYSLASMLAGEGEDSIRLVESAVDHAEVSACFNIDEARRSSRRVLCGEALELLASRDAASLAPPAGLDEVKPCIDDDDLAAAGISGEELERMIAGPDRPRVRNWLEGLPTAHRVIFVLRAVAGIHSPQAAELLVRRAGPQAASWTPDLVREVFRQALCSLASQLLHASAARD